MELMMLHSEAETVILPHPDVRKKQVGGDHYSKHAIQPWDIIEEYGLDYWEGNALKYLLRRKGPRVQDLAKAIHYLEHSLSREKIRNTP